MCNFILLFKPIETLVTYLSHLTFWPDFVHFCASFNGFNEALIVKIAAATDDTIYMVIISGFWSMIIGLPLGISLYTTRTDHILACKPINFLLSLLTTIFRSIPFIILVVWMIPFTKSIITIFIGYGTFIGKQAAIVPLSIGIAPFIARMIENALLDIPTTLIEAVRAMGAKPLQIIYKVLLPEALPAIINSMTITLITLTSYITMAGAIGAGGLGQLAIQYGYNSYKPAIINIVIILLIIITFLIQLIGNKLVRKVTHN